MEETESNSLGKGCHTHSCVEFPLRNDLLRMYEQKLFTDVTISVEDSYISFEAHKLILATRSSVFADMVLDIQGSNPTIKLKEITVRVLNLILWYVYSDELKTHSPEELIEVAKAARRFEIGGLIRSCKRHLAHCPMNIGSVFSILEASKYFKLEIIRDKCLQFIKSASPAILFGKPDLLQVSQETFISILKNRNTSTDSDVHAVKGIMRWLEHHNKRQRELLKEVNILSLNCDEFLDLVEKFPSFFTSREISLVLSKILRPTMEELPDWCQSNLETMDHDLSSEDYNAIAENSLEVKTDCNRQFLKSCFFEEDGFEGTVTFELKLTNRFPKLPYLVMLQLAFGSDYVPKENLDLKLFSYEQGSLLKKRKIKFSLEITGEHYYVKVSHHMRLQKNHPFVFNLRLKVNGLTKWGVDGPVSNRQYRVAKIPENIFYQMGLNAGGFKSVCLTPLSDWIMFIDPVLGEKRLIFTSFYFSSPFK